MVHRVQLCGRTLKEMCPHGHRERGCSMNLREKYGEWGLILGATEGVGKAFCEKIAAGGMNVVMVGRREEKLNVLAGEIRETYGVET